MRDDKTNAAQDATLVYVNDDDHVRYWCERFGCTETELREAVEAVGALVAKVEAFLHAARSARDTRAYFGVYRGSAGGRAVAAP